MLSALRCAADDFPYLDGKPSVPHDSDSSFSFAKCRVSATLPPVLDQSTSAFETPPRNTIHATPEASGITPDSRFPPDHSAGGCRSDLAGQGSRSQPGGRSRLRIRDALPARLPGRVATDPASLAYHRPNTGERRPRLHGRAFRRVGNRPAQADGLAGSNRARSGMP